MDIIVPQPEMFLLPSGTLPIDHGGPDYTTLPTLTTPGGKVISQWLPTAEELYRLMQGEPLTLVLHTFGKPLQPIILAVGGLDLR